MGFVVASCSKLESSFPVGLRSTTRRRWATWTVVGGVRGRSTGWPRDSGGDEDKAVGEEEEEEEEERETNMTETGTDWDFAEGPSGRSENQFRASLAISDPVLVSEVGFLSTTRNLQDRILNDGVDAKDGLKESLDALDKRFAREGRETEQHDRCVGCGCATPPEELANFDGVCRLCHGQTLTRSSPALLSGPSQGSFRDNRSSRSQSTVLQEVESARRGFLEARQQPTSNVESNQDSNGDKQTGQWRVRASRRSMRTINPIRNVVQGSDMVPNPAREVIKLNVGDPCVYGNLKVAEEINDELLRIIRGSNSNGYPSSNGREDAREAVAEYFSAEIPSRSLTKDDVLLSSGASGALEAAIGALCDEGDNILLPKPGFPLFQTLAEGMGVECRYYELNPDRAWEINLDGIEELVDDRTAAWVINNPSNPCGSCYNARHLKEIVSKAQQIQIPIIADEIYHGMTFSGVDFVPIASVGEGVPMLVIGGISKQFVVPGWRLGWILVYDDEERLRRGDVRKGLQQLSTRMLLPCSLIQSVIPWLLRERQVTDSEVSIAFREMMSQLEENVRLVLRGLSSTRGIRCVPPQGAMYLMIQLDCSALGVKDDVEFVKQLYAEESVYLLPGSCFQAPGFARMVISVDADRLTNACHAIRCYCDRKFAQRRS
eukprot:CAMPEP_0184690118 /NCGR_PEP_ID=MMETSP0312-20130426/31040_1 /TAXON_ID=31354 /ORGANISM="Compsopogon coeruleus, Strain SAG 36.94" /LENGTH=660 /DNA_ID=CAMNT_0027147559 /DNA_START=358 /DNA_END=2340 /DNA_ORIENTATION=-